MAGACTSNKRKARAAKPGVIRNDEVLTLPEFKDRMRMAAWAWRTVRREASELGIELCVYQGNNGYVSGEAWHDYLKAKAAKKRTN